MVRREIRRKRWKKTFNKKREAKYEIMIRNMKLYFSFFLRTSIFSFHTFTGSTINSLH